MITLLAYPIRCWIAIALSTPTKPDHLNLKVKQRSPLITQNPIAYFPHQTAIAPQHPQTRSPKSQHQTAIAPHQPQTRSPLITKPDLQILEQIVMSTSISRAKLDKSV